MFHVVTNHMKVSFAHIEGFIDETKTRINNKNRIIMKKILLSLVLLLCVGSAFGQDARKLMAKWKATAGAKFEVKTEEVRKALEENKMDGAFGISKEDYEFAQKSFKYSSELRLKLDDKQKNQLESDLQSLKGYEMLVLENNNENEQQKVVKQDTVAITPNYKLQVYGKIKGEIISDLLFRCDMLDEVDLQYVDQKMKKDVLLNCIFKGYRLVSFE